MLRSNLVRILLAAIFVAAILAIILSIRSRTERLEPPPQPAELLPRDISRHSTGFEFSQLKQGRVVFKVYAKTSTMTAGGEHELEEVRLVGLDDQGKVTDRVEARGALYRIDDKQIEFRKDVRIWLTDGTEIRADRAAADLGAETVNIREDFRFTHGELTGSGKGLRYRVSTKVLAADEGLDLSSHSGSAPIRARAGTATYDLVHGRIALRDRVRIDSGERRLEADAVSIGLSEERRIDSLHAVGGAELQLSDAESVSGQRIWIGFPADRDQVGHLVSSAGDDGSNGVRAKFVQRGPAGHQLMEGDRIVVPFRLATESESTRVRLESLSTDGDVRIRGSSDVLEEGRADFGEAEFNAASGEISRFTLTDHVRLRGRFGPSDGPADVRRQSMTCGSLDVRMRGPAQIESMQAEGPIDLTSTGDHVERRLQAEDGLTASYREGLLRRLVAQGRCRLRSSEGGETSLVTASRMELELDEEGPRQSAATGGVHLEVTRDENHLVSSGDSLVLHYVDGIAQEAVESGSFVLDQQNTDGNRLHLSGDEGRYDLQAGLLEVRARSRPELEFTSPTGSLKTSARVVHLDRIKEEVTAEGDVETTFDAGGRPSVVTAARMTASLATGEMEFEGNRPRLVQGSNLIRAGTLRIKSGPGNLEATEDVDSVWMDESGTAPREFKVQSQRLVLDSQENHAVYEEAVRLESQDLLLKAPRLELFFLPPPASGLDRLEASGGVEIVERGRHWRAERATYLRKSDRVVATK